MSQSKINGNSVLRDVTAPVAPGQLPEALRKEARWMRNMPQAPTNPLIKAHVVILLASAEHIERLEKQVLELIGDATKNAETLTKV